MRKNSKGEMVEVDLKNEDFDQNAFVKEKNIDEFDNKTYKKIEKNKLLKSSITKNITNRVNRNE